MAVSRKEEVFLLEASPLDPLTNGITSVRLSSGAAHNEFDGNKYSPRLSVALNYTAEILPDNTPGASSVGASNISIANPDGEFDHLLDYAWDGRSVVIKYSPDASASYSSFQTVFAGTAKQVLAAENELLLVLRDNSELLAIPIQESKYAGTGGAEGAADLKDRLRPLLWGKAYSVEPVLVDAAKLIYQVNDGPLTTVHGVFDMGVALTAAADSATFTTLNAIDAALILPGTYRTCLAEGYIRLGAPPAGIVSLDVTGFNTTNVSDIVYNIITTKGGMVDADLDLASFTAFEADNPWETGYFLQDPDVNVDSVVEELVGSVYGYWFYNILGKITVGTFKFASPETTEIRKKDVQSIRRESSELPAHALDLNWRRVWRVHDSNEIAFEAKLVEKGLYDDTVTYVEGNVVSLADGSRWVYVWPIPTSGNDPVEGSIYWLQLSPALMSMFVGNLTNYSQAVRVDTAGTPDTLVYAGGQFKVFVGATPKGSADGVVFSIVSQTGGTFNITSEGVYSTLTLTADNASVTFSAALSGYSPIELTFTVHKSYPGVDGVVNLMHMRAFPTAVQFTAAHEPVSPTQTLTYYVDALGNLDMANAVHKLYRISGATETLIETLQPGVEGTPYVGVNATAQRLGDKGDSSRGMVYLSGTQYDNAVSGGTSLRLLTEIVYDSVTYTEEAEIIKVQNGKNSVLLKINGSRSIMAYDKDGNFK